MNSFTNRVIAIAVFLTVVGVGTSVHIDTDTSVTVHRPDDQSGIAVVMRLRFGASPLALFALSRLHQSFAGDNPGLVNQPAIDAASAPRRSSSKCQIC
jgi:hypothetical protein